MNTKENLSLIYYLNLDQGNCLYVNFGLMELPDTNLWRVNSRNQAELPSLCLAWGFLCGVAVKNLPAVQEMQELWVRFLGQEDPLEEGITTHSSFIAWRMPWTEEPGRLQSLGL